MNYTRETAGHSVTTDAISRRAGLSARRRLVWDEGGGNVILGRRWLLHEPHPMITSKLVTRRHQPSLNFHLPVRTSQDGDATRRVEEVYGEGERKAISPGVAGAGAGAGRVPRESLSSRRH